MLHSFIQPPLNIGILIRPFPNHAPPPPTPPSLPTPPNNGFSFFSSPSPSLPPPPPLPPILPKLPIFKEFNCSKRAETKIETVARFLSLSPPPSSPPPSLILPPDSIPTPLMILLPLLFILPRNLPLTSPPTLPLLSKAAGATRATGAPPIRVRAKDQTFPISSRTDLKTCPAMVLIMTRPVAISSVIPGRPDSLGGP